MSDGIRARVLADSLSPGNVRLTSFEVRLPTVVWPQILTHAALSRNARSFRAVPTLALLKEVANDPFIPGAWGRAGKGMVADGMLDPDAAERCRAHWLAARGAALGRAREMAGLGAAKESTNRLLTPFTWTYAVLTATDWANFFALRTAGDAQPETRDLAVKMARAMRESEPRSVPAGEWHLPYVTEDERAPCVSPSDWAALAGISAARVARVSYRPFDGATDDVAERARFNRLVAGGHWSPLASPATPLDDPEARSGNFRGWKSLRKFYPGENITDFDLWSV